MTSISIILIINACLSLLVATYFCIHKKIIKGLLLTTFCLVAPVVGILCLVVSIIVNKVIMKKVKKPLSIQELSIEGKRTQAVLEVDIESESDKIPLREAMIATNIRRQ